MPLEALAAEAGRAGAAPSGAGGCGRFSDSRIENSNSRRRSRPAVETSAALISISSGFSSHGELYSVLRRNSETRSLVCATPTTATTSPVCLIEVR